MPLILPAFLLPSSPIFPHASTATFHRPRPLQRPRAVHAEKPPPVKSSPSPAPSPAPSPSRSVRPSSPPSSPGSSPPPENNNNSPIKALIFLTLSFLTLTTLLSLFPSSLELPPTLERPPTPPHEALIPLISTFVTGPRFPIAVGMGLSAFIQSLTGFGFAIVSVSILTQLPWIANSSVFNTIQPVAATLGALTGWLLLLPEIKRVKWKEISTLLIASTITTPFGALVLEYFDVGIVIKVLGAFIAGYVLYSLTGIRVPKQLGGNGGAWGLGFLAGALGGAFDITGPPLVVHGEAAGWPNAGGDFRRNILAVVSVNSTLVVLWDLLIGRLDDFYYWDFLKYGAPTTVVGIFMGKILAERLDPASFKRIVLATCLVMGVKLLVS